MSSIHGKWILDSGCSYHICSSQEMLSTFDATQGGEIKLANGAMCKVVRIGTMEIRMRDGIVRTLHGVRHVPG